MEPVRSEVRVELWSRCPVRSKRACSSSESHCIGTQEMETATQTLQSQCYVEDQVGGSVQINQ